MPLPPGMQHIYDAYQGAADFEGRKEAPGILDRVNYVTEKWEDPCVAPWTVYLETLWPCTLRMVIQLATFGLLDIMRGLFRPSRQLNKLSRDPLTRFRSRPPGIPGKRKRGKGMIGRVGGMLAADIGGEIGKKMPGARGMRGRYVTDGVRHLWLIDGVLQRAAWYWLVADVTTEFAYNWTSLLYETKYCQEAKASHLLVSRKGGTADALGGWKAAGELFVEKVRGDLHWNHSTVGFPEGDFQVVAAAQATPYDHSPMARYQIRLIVRDRNGVNTYGTDFQGPSNNEDEGQVQTVSVKGPGSVSFEHRVDVGAVHTDSLYLVAHGKRA